MNRRDCQTESCDFTRRARVNIEKQTSKNRFDVMNERRGKKNRYPLHFSHIVWWSENEYERIQEREKEEAWKKKWKRISSGMSERFKERERERECMRACKKKRNQIAINISFFFLTCLVPLSTHIQERYASPFRRAQRTKKLKRL